MSSPQQFDGFTTGDTPSDTDSVVGSASGGGAGSNRQWPWLSAYNYILFKLGLGTLAKQNSVNLASQATGNLPVVNLGGGTGASSSTFWRGDDTWATPAGTGGAIVTGSTGALISSLQSDPDIDNPGANGDEFVQNSAGLPSGWTAIGSGAFNSVNTSDFYSQVHCVSDSGGGIGGELRGFYKTAPSLPFTMTAKLSDCVARSDATGGTYYGIFIGEASAAGKFSAVCTQVRDGTNYLMAVARSWASRTSATSTFGTILQQVCSGRPPLYMRIVASSSLSATYQISYDNELWSTISSAVNPEFTIASVGIFIDAADATINGEATFDWIRFT